MAIGLMVPLAGHLPKVMQRSLAFLPIANVDSDSEPTVTVDAALLVAVSNMTTET